MFLKKRRERLRPPEREVHRRTGETMAAWSSAQRPSACLAIMLWSLSLSKYHRTIESNILSPLNVCIFCVIGQQPDVRLAE